MDVRWMFMALVCLVGGNATAFTYVPMSDATLLQQADVVLFGEVKSRSPAMSASQAVTQYQVQVLEVYKGSPNATEIMVQIPGDRQYRIIPGVVQFNLGTRAILFLKARSDGRYRLLQLNLGSLLFDDARNELQKPLEGLTRIPVLVPYAPQGSDDGPVDATAFRNWLIGQLPASGLVLGQLPARTLPPPISKYQLLAQPNSLPGRWFTFDGGGSVTIYADSTPLSGMTSGGYPELEASIAAWTNDPNSNIDYRYGGKRDLNGGLMRADGFNSMLFNDPNDEVDGSFNCLTGGVLALGGYGQSGSATYRGNVFGQITEVDIVTNDNTGCFFRQLGGTHAQEVFTHELGHTLGLGHSCGDSTLLVLQDCTLAAIEIQQAIMRATPHADGRGASLSDDDKDAIAALYGSGTVNPDNGQALGVLFDLVSSAPETPADTGTHEQPQVGNQSSSLEGAEKTTNQSGTSSGGCSAIQAGTDKSLVLLLLGIFATLCWRRNRVAS